MSDIFGVTSQSRCDDIKLVIDKIRKGEKPTLDEFAALTAHISVCSVCSDEFASLDISK